MTEVKFTKEKLRVNSKVNELLLNDAKLQIGRTNDDFVKDLFTVQLEAGIMARLNEKKN